MTLRLTGEEKETVLRALVAQEEQLSTMPNLRLFGAEELERTRKLLKVLTRGEFTPKGLVDHLTAS